MELSPGEFEIKYQKVMEDIYNVTEKIKKQLEVLNQTIAENGLLQNSIKNGNENLIKQAEANGINIHQLLNNNDNNDDDDDDDDNDNDSREARLMNANFLRRITEQIDTIVNS